MFVHTSRGVANSGPRGSNLGDSGWVVRPRGSTNFNLEVTVGVDLLHTAHLAKGLLINGATNSLVYGWLLSL